MVKRMKFLTIAVCAALCCAWALAAAAAPAGADSELLGAVEAGVITQADLADLDAPVTEADLYRALLQSVALNTDISARSAARASALDKTSLTRNHAATLIYTVVLENYFGIEDTDELYPYDCFAYAQTMNTYANRSGEAQPCLEFAQLNAGAEIDIDLWSVGYCCLQYDPYTLAPIMDVNADNALRSGDLMTRAEAWKAAYRLYHAYRPSHLLTLAEVQPLALSDAQLAQAALMPDARYNSLPAWKGTALDHKTYASSAHHTGSMYTQQDFEILHDLGFNFTRLMITHELLFDLSDGVAVQSRELNNLDSAIGFAIEYGVHLCICFADFPGFAGASMDAAGFTDADMLKQVTAAYAILAKRYQNVPSSVLSFDLFNEPWLIVTKAEEQQYVDAVHAVSEGIWAFGDRLIFVDGIHGSQEPVQSLADEPYAQALHMYAPDQFTYSGWVGETTWYAGQQWPLPYANGMLFDGESLTLQGNFEAGTQVELLMVGNPEDGSWQLIADGKKTATLALSAHESEGGKTAVLGVLDAAATEIQIRWKGSGYGQLESVAVISTAYDEAGTPVYSSPWAPQSVRELDHRKMTVIYCDYGQIDGSHKPSTLILHSDGTYENLKQSTLTYDQEYFRDFLTPWVEFQQKTGVGIMVQEWGTLYCTAKQASLAYIRDWVSLLGEYHIGWNLWSDGWQYLNTNRLDVDYESYRGFQLDRDMVNALTQ